MRNRLKEGIEHCKILKFLAEPAEGGFTGWLTRVGRDERKKQMKRNFSRTIV
jgi:hypothetical protein